MKLPTYSDVLEAAEAVKGRVTRTPLLRSVELDRVTGGEIFIKPECLQLTGAFKLRGAFNRLTRLSEAQRKAGVVAYSSGNHGQAVAFAAKTLGVHAAIVMPENAPKIKVEKTRSHGAEIILYDPDKEVREVISAKLASERGAVLVPSYEDFYIIAGQGTSALEVVEDMEAKGETLECYLVGTGGGGLIAGSSLVFAERSPETRLYSVEPEGRDDHALSFEAGQRTAHAPDPEPTICDALFPKIPGEMTFSINKENVSGGLRVSDDEVRAAMRFAFENLKIVCEPGGCVALAAVLSGKLETKGKKIGLIITGGNVDPVLFREVLA